MLTILDIALGVLVVFSAIALLAVYLYARLVKDLNAIDIIIGDYVNSELVKD